MLRRLKSDKEYSLIPFLEAVLAILIPVAMLFCAYYFGLKESKIPEELSLRNAPFDETFFEGVENDIKSVWGFSFSRDMRTVFSEHMDPFFLLALILPTSCTEFILYLGFFLRFGLASFTMNRLIRKQVPIGIWFSAVLSVAYSLGSSLLSMSSYSLVMDTAIMIPLVFDMLIEYLRDDKSIIKGIKLSFVISLTLYISGVLNLLTVLPFVIGASLFISTCVTQTLPRSLLSFVKSLIFIVLSAGLSLPTLVNTATFSRVAITLEDLKNYEFKMTVYDMILRFLDGKAINNSLPHGLGIGMSVFVLMLLLAFFLNAKIPLRSRITLLSIALFIFLTYSSKAAYRATILFESNTIGSQIIAVSRFALLSSLLIFATAISLRNISDMPSGKIGLIALAVIIIVIISNNTHNETSPSIFSMYFTGLCAIAIFFFFREKEFLGDAIPSFAILLGIFINISFILPISTFSLARDDDFRIFDKKQGDSCIEMPYDELDFFDTDKDEYMILYNYYDGYNGDIEMINNIVVGAYAEPAFMPIMETFDVYTPDGRIGDLMMVEGRSVAAYKNVRLDPWEREQDLYAYTNHSGTVIMRIETEDKEYDLSLRGPGLLKIEPPADEFKIMFLIIGSPTAVQERYDIYAIDPYALDNLSSVIHPIDGPFEVQGPATIVTGRKIGDNIRVKVNGESVSIYNIGGKAAFDIESEGVNEVEIVSSGSYLIICFVVAMVLLLCSIVVIIYTSRRRKKSNER